MKTKVVTDSTSDIPAEVARSLGVAVVPVYVRFGEEVYRDGVDMSSDELFRKMVESPIHPATSQPSPEDFARVYAQCATEAESIVSIHISSKISGTYNSALLAKSLMDSRCPIEVVDSTFNSVGLALVVIAAARRANAGDGLEDVLAETQRAIGHVHMFGMFGTTKYLALSGRVSKTIAAAADILNVKPLLTFRDGEIVRAGLVRTVSKGIDRLCEFVKSKENIQELALVHGAVPEQAAQLKKRLGALFPEDQILVMQLGAALAVHGGPGVLVLALRCLDVSR